MFWVPGSLANPTFAIRSTHGLSHRLRLPPLHTYCCLWWLPKGRASPGCSLSITAEVSRLPLVSPLTSSGSLTSHMVSSLGFSSWPLHSWAFHSNQGCTFTNSHSCTTFLQGESSNAQACQASDVLNNPLMLSQWVQCGRLLHTTKVGCWRVSFSPLHLRPQPCADPDEVPPFVSLMVFSY